MKSWQIFLVLLGLAFLAGLWDRARRDSNRLSDMTSLSLSTEHDKDSGRSLEEFSLTNLDGKKEFRGAELKGHGVILNFWATWCPPCVEEFPSLLRLAKKANKERGFLFVAASVDESIDEIRDFLKDQPDLLKAFGALAPWDPNFAPLEQGLHVAWDREQAMALKFGSLRFPETYIFDSQHRLVKRFVGAQDWDSKEVWDWLRRID